MKEAGCQIRDREKATSCLPTGTFIKVSTFKERLAEKGSTPGETEKYMTESSKLARRKVQVFGRG